MTSPQPHCEHECVCDDFHPEYDPDYQEVCNNKDCEHDTRSRPAQSADAVLKIKQEIYRDLVGRLDARTKAYQQVLLMLHQTDLQLRQIQQQHPNGKQDGERG